MWTVEGAVAHMAGFAEQGVDSLDFVELADGIINAFWRSAHPEVHFQRTRAGER